MAAAHFRKVVAMNLAKVQTLTKADKPKPQNRKIPAWSWFWFILGALYFILPLYATLQFSLQMKRDQISLLAYQKAFEDPQFIKTFTYSNVLALATILAGIILFVPTAYWIRL